MIVFYRQQMFPVPVRRWSILVRVHLNIQLFNDFLRLAAKSRTEKDINLFKVAERK